MNSIKIYEILLMVFIPFIFVVSVIPLVSKIALHIGAMDMPNERKVHKKAMPRLGGLGIYAMYVDGFMMKQLEMQI